LAQAFKNWFINTCLKQCSQTGFINRALLPLTLLPARLSLPRFPRSPFIRLSAKLFRVSLCLVFRSSLTLLPCRLLSLLSFSSRVALQFIELLPTQCVPISRLFLSLSSSASTSCPQSPTVASQTTPRHQLPDPGMASGALLLSVRGGRIYLVAGRGWIPHARTSYFRSASSFLHFLAREFKRSSVGH
jgi:hypothetical protein